MSDDLKLQISNYTKSMSLLITEETNAIRHSINELNTTVKVQNGSVKGLKEWRARVEGKEQGMQSADNKRHMAVTRVLQTIGVIIALGSLLLVLNRRNKERDLALMREIRINTQPVMKSRGGMFYDPVDGRTYLFDSTKIVKLDSLINVVLKL